MENINSHSIYKLASIKWLLFTLLAGISGGISASSDDYEIYEVFGIWDKSLGKSYAINDDRSSNPRFYFKVLEKGWVDIKITTLPKLQKENDCTKAIDTYLYLINAVDDLIAENDDIGSLKFSNNSFIDSWKLPENRINIPPCPLESGMKVELKPGAYTLVAATYKSGESASFFLSIGGNKKTISRLSNKTITDDQIMRGHWEKSGGHKDKDNSGNKFYTFNLDKKAEVTIDLTADKSSLGIHTNDTYLYLLKADGTGQMQDDDSGGRFQARINETLEAGRYKIIATTYWPNKAGNFTLDLTAPSGVILEEWDNKYKELQQKKQKVFKCIGIDKVCFNLESSKNEEEGYEQALRVHYSDVSYDVSFDLYAGEEPYLLFSENEAVATFEENDKKLKINGVGSTKLKAILSSGRVGHLQLNVVPGLVKLNFDDTSEIRVNYQSDKILAGRAAKAQISLDYYPIGDKDFHGKPDVKLTYRSSNEKVARVDSNGIIWVIAPGTTTIRAFTTKHDSYTYRYRPDADLEQYQYSLTVFKGIYSKPELNSLHKNYVGDGFEHDPFKDDVPLFRDYIKKDDRYPNAKYRVSSNNKDIVEIKGDYLSIKSTGVVSISVFRIENDKYQSSDPVTFKLTIKGLSRNLKVDDIKELAYKHTGLIRPNLVFDGANENSKITYKIISGKKFVDIDSKGQLRMLGAGTAKVEVTVPKSPIYDSETITFDITVKKRRKLSIENTSILYYPNGSIDPEPMVDGSVRYEGITYEFISGRGVVEFDEKNHRFKIKGVGTARIKAILAPTENYAKERKEFTITVNPGRRKLIVKNINEPYQPDGLIDPNSEIDESHPYDGLTYFVAGGEEYVEFDGKIRQFKIKGAGTAVVYATLPSTDNYAEVSKEFVITVDKASRKISVDDKGKLYQPDGIIYPNPEVDESLPDDKIIYKVLSGGHAVEYDRKNSQFKIKGVGRAKVRASLLSTKNYKPDSDDFFIDVNPIRRNLIVEDINIPYQPDGEINPNPKVDGSISEGIIYEVISGDEFVIYDKKSGKLKIKGVGKAEVMAILNPIENHHWIEMDEFSITVNMAKQKKVELENKSDSIKFSEKKYQINIPDNISQSDLQFKSEHGDIAVVDNQGLVTIKSENPNMALPITAIINVWRKGNPNYHDSEKSEFKLQITKGDQEVFLKKSKDSLSYTKSIDLMGYVDKENSIGDGPFEFRPANKKDPCFSINNKELLLNYPCEAKIQVFMEGNIKWQKSQEETLTLQFKHNEEIQFYEKGQNNKVIAKGVVNKNYGDANFTILAKYPDVEDHQPQFNYEVTKGDDFAEVNINTGEVTIKGVGEVEIKAEAVTDKSKNFSKHKKSYILKINKGHKPIEFLSSDNRKLLGLSEKTFSIKDFIKKEDKDIDENFEFSYLSFNLGNAIDEKGIVTLNSQGMSAVLVTRKESNNYKAASAFLKFIISEFDPNPQPQPKVKNVEITAYPKEIGAGDAVEFSVDYNVSDKTTSIRDLSLYVFYDSDKLEWNGLLKEGVLGIVDDSNSADIGTRFIKEWSSARGEFELLGGWDDDDEDFTDGDNSTKKLLYMRWHYNPDSKFRTFDDEANGKGFIGDNSLPVKLFKTVSFIRKPSFVSGSTTIRFKVEEIRKTRLGNVGGGYGFTSTPVIIAGSSSNNSPPEPEDPKPEDKAKLEKIRFISLSPEKNNVFKLNTAANKTVFGDKFDIKNRENCKLYIQKNSFGDLRSSNPYFNTTEPYDCFDATLPLVKKDETYYAIMKFEDRQGENISFSEETVLRQPKFSLTKPETINIRPDDSDKSFSVPVKFTADTRTNPSLGVVISFNADKLEFLGLRNVQGLKFNPDENSNFDRETELLKADRFKNLTENYDKKYGEFKTFTHLNKESYLKYQSIDDLAAFDDMDRETNSLLMLSWRTNDTPSLATWQDPEAEAAGGFLKEKPDKLLMFEAVFEPKADFTKDQTRINFNYNYVVDQKGENIGDIYHFKPVKVIAADTIKVETHQEESSEDTVKISVDYHKDETTKLPRALTLFIGYDSKKLTFKGFDTDTRCYTQPTEEEKSRGNFTLHLDSGTFPQCSLVSTMELEVEGSVGQERIYSLLQKQTSINVTRVVRASWFDIGFDDNSFHVGKDKSEASVTLLSTLFKRKDSFTSGSTDVYIVQQMGGYGEPLSYFQIGKQTIHADPEVIAGQQPNQEKFIEITPKDIKYHAESANLQFSVRYTTDTKGIPSMYLFIYYDDSKLDWNGLERSSVLGYLDPEGVNSGESNMINEDWKDTGYGEFRGIHHAQGYVFDKTKKYIENVENKVAYLDGLDDTKAVIVLRWTRATIGNGTFRTGSSGFVPEIPNNLKLFQNSFKLKEGLQANESTRINFRIGDGEHGTKHGRGYPLFTTSIIIEKDNNGGVSFNLSKKKKILR